MGVVGDGGGSTPDFCFLSEVENFPCSLTYNGLFSQPLQRLRTPKVCLFFRARYFCLRWLFLLTPIAAVYRIHKSIFFAFFYFVKFNQSTSIKYLHWNHLHCSVKFIMVMYLKLKKKGKLQMYCNAELLITTKSCLEVKFLNCYNTPTSFPLRLIITRVFSSSLTIFLNLEYFRYLK